MYSLFRLGRPNFFFVANCALLAFREEGRPLQDKPNVRICNIFLGIHFSFLCTYHLDTLHLSILKLLFLLELHKLRNCILYSAQLINPQNKIPIVYSLLRQTVTASIYGVTWIAVTHWPVCSIPGRRKRFFPFLKVQAGSVVQPTSYTSPSLPGRKAQVELRKTMERVGMKCVRMKRAWI